MRSFEGYFNLGIMKKHTLRYRIIVLLAILMTQANFLFARVYHGTSYTMTQPNGDSVSVLLYGTDLFIDAESVDHYTLTTDEKSHEICYAMLSADGREYASSGIVYKGGPAPEAVKMLVEPSIRISKESREEKIAQTKETLHRQEESSDKPQLRAATVLPDTVYGICILIDFPDVKTTVTREQIYQFLNGDNNPQFGNARSIKEYFQWISSGKLTYINYVPQNFHTTPYNKAYYAPLDATGYTIDNLSPEIRNALNEWGKERPDNFKRLTKNIYGGIKALNVLYAGKCENKWGTGLWPHMSHLQMKLDGNEFSRTGWHSYQITDLDGKLTMGTFVHENGHLVCDWPDFYQYEEHEANNADKYNIGDAFNISSETNPTYPNAWALDQLGWLTHKQDITNVQGGKVITLTQGVGHAAVYRGTGKNANEAFYLEVRDKHHATWGNRDKGIFIWHSNSEGDNNYPSVHELLDCRPATINNPFWAKGNGPDVFSDNSNPHARWDDGTNSGIYLWDFSEYRENMTFRCGQYIEQPEFTKTEIKKGGIYCPYTDTLTFMGGDAPYRATLYAGNLPEGIQLDESGIFYGTPAQIGEVSFTIQVTDARGKTAYQAFTLSIVSSSPYKNDPFPIPGSFQMEEYDMGGKGIAYQTERPSSYIRSDESLFPLYKFANRNTGATLGWAVLYQENNEWLQFTVDVEKSGDYEMTLRNATNYDATLGIIVDYQEIDTLRLVGDPNATITSNSRGYKFTTKLLNLTAGKHQLRLAAKEVSHPLYMDSVSFTYVPSPNLTLNPKEINDSKEYHLMQNPSLDHFTLLDTKGNETISVYTVTGELLETLYGEENNTLFGAHYPTGIYILQIQSGAVLVTLKAVKTQ